MIKNIYKGFTLIELLVSISIVGILATLVLVSFTGAQKQARDTTRKSDLKQYQLKIDLFLKEYKDNPHNWVLETYHNEKLNQKELSLEPIWAYDYLDKYVWSKYDLIVLMSGTIFCAKYNNAASLFSVLKKEPNRKVLILSERKNQLKDIEEIIKDNNISDDKKVFLRVLPAHYHHIVDFYGNVINFLNIDPNITFIFSSRDMFLLPEPRKQFLYEFLNKHNAKFHFIDEIFF